MSRQLSNCRGKNESAAAISHFSHRLIRAADKSVYKLEMRKSVCFGVQV